jgi:uncharacterized protein (UPF0333 family)
MKMINISPRMKSTSKKRGQSMVEFALALPILLLLLFGLKMGPALAFVLLSLAVMTRSTAKKPGLP